MKTKLLKAPDGAIFQASQITCIRTDDHAAMSLDSSLKSAYGFTSIVGQNHRILIHFSGGCHVIDYKDNIQSRDKAFADLVKQYESCSVS